MFTSRTSIPMQLHEGEGVSVKYWLKLFGVMMLLVLVSAFVFQVLRKGHRERARLDPHQVRATFDKVRVGMSSAEASLVIGDMENIHLWQPTTMGGPMRDGPYVDFSSTWPQPN